MVGSGSNAVILLRGNSHLKNRVAIPIFAPQSKMFSGVTWEQIFFVYEDFTVQITKGVGIQAFHLEVKDALRQTWRETAREREPAKISSPRKLLRRFTGPQKTCAMSEILHRFPPVLTRAFGLESRAGSRYDLPANIGLYAVAPTFAALYAGGHVESSFLERNPDIRCGRPCNPAGTLNSRRQATGKRAIGQAILRLTLGGSPPRWPLWATNPALKQFGRLVREAVEANTPDAVLSISSRCIIYYQPSVPFGMFCDAPWMHGSRVIGNMKRSR